MFYKKYYEDFFVEQTQKVKDKIIWTFDLIEELDKVPEIYFKHMEGTDGLYEIRVQNGRGYLQDFQFF